MILVTAASGQIGSAALGALATTNARIRAMVRNPPVFTAPAGVEVVAGDFDDVGSLDRALAGVEVLLLAGRDSPESVSRHLRVLESARLAGVRHVVKLSAIGAAPGSPVALMREHYEVDEAVRDGFADWTFLKPHLFMQNLLRASDAVRNEGILAAPMGKSRFPLVDTRDVGAAAAAVLREPQAHTGSTYALTGPAALGYADVAVEIARVAGHAVAYEAVTPEEFETRLRSAGMPDWRAFDLANIASAYSAADNAVSTDLPDLLGRNPRSFGEFLQDHKDAYAV